jgi:hypothetical protein
VLVVGFFSMTGGATVVEVDLIVRWPSSSSSLWSLRLVCRLFPKVVSSSSFWLLVLERTDRDNVRMPCQKRGSRKKTRNTITPPRPLEIDAHQINVLLLIIK